MHIYYVNGHFCHKDISFVSVEDRGFNFSDGVYEVISFQNSKIVNLDKHFKRLERSLNGLSISNPYNNFKSLELIFKRLIKINKIFDGFIYLQITRGTSARNHQFPPSICPNIVIFCFLKKDIKKLLNGVTVGISDDLRWKRCDIKSISLLPNLLEKQKAVEQGYYEIWQTSGNYITEGSTSNAFIVTQDNIIKTHPSNNYILGGVTRDCVIEIAKTNNLSLEEKAFTINELKIAKEAFLSSTTAGIIPVTKVNNFKIANGKKGDLTIKISKLYCQYINEQLHE